MQLVILCKECDLSYFLDRIFSFICNPAFSLPNQNRDRLCPLLRLGEAGGDYFRVTPKLKDTVNCHHRNFTRRNSHLFELYSAFEAHASR